MPKPSAQDQKNLDKIAVKLGIKLQQMPIADIWMTNKGYSCDVAGNVTGMNLDIAEIADISFLKDFPRLTHLSLAWNRIIDLSPLQELAQLTELYLWNNQITDLSPLKALTQLIELDLSNNQVAHLSPLTTLTKLTELNLSHNQIDDLSSLQELTELTHLDLSYNQIDDLSPLQELAQLTHLDLSVNQIADLSPLQALIQRMGIEWEYKSGGGIFLKGNKIEIPPPEIVKQGIAAIRNYFKELERESVLLLQCKLLIVGNGEVGKTTLMKKLLDNNYQFKVGTEETTRGIDIKPWLRSCSFPDGQTHDVQVHFWDFGGQDILHATHQFFLTKRSLYLFVWDARKEEEAQSFDYWLNIIKLLSDNSSALVVMNKSEIRIKHIDEASFKEKFINIAGFLQVSCVTGHHIRELTQAIHANLAAMPHLMDKLPKRWLDIRDDLQAMKDNYIPLERYFQVCRAHDMEEEKALFLSDYLHDLGVILHFRSDPLLTDTVILKPEWATGAVYALIDTLEIQKNKGRFNLSDLHTYWDCQTYPPDKHTQLIRLMEKFELCFNIVGTDDYILPELLPAKRPAAIDFAAYRSSGNLHLNYMYDFMPAGIITRFISRIHYLIHDNRYWKNGVELKFNDANALAVSDSVQGYIRVSVSGRSPDQLMAIIRSHFDHIHETLNMKKNEHVFEKVPCVCSQCVQSGKPHFFKYDYLDRLSQINENARCEISLENIPVDRLLMGLLPPAKPGELRETLIKIASQLQGISKTLQRDENSRNTVLALLFGVSGFRVKDQTLWSGSSTGRRMGELDIKIENETGRTVSIIEAFNLTGWNKTVIESHIKKLFKYDCNGLEEIFILVYAQDDDLSAQAERYKENLTQIDYGKYPLLASKKTKIETIETGFHKIMAFRARHKCEQGWTDLYHILVKM